ncbi:MAG: N-acetyltransferase [Flavobacteriaceae bacterium]|nr:N-acetyltransferase [Flavobacteriaceae bacterium]
MSCQIKHKEGDSKGKFYMEDEIGITSELRYSTPENGVLIIDHTETRIEFKGKGLASKLVKQSVEYARENNLKIVPGCSYAKVHFDRHEEYKDVLKD